MRIHELISEVSAVKQLFTRTEKQAAPGIGQNFNLGRQKGTLELNIKGVIQSGQPADFTPYIYSLLRRGQAVDMVDQLGFSAAEKAAYKTATDAWQHNTGAWAQKDFGPAKAVASQAGDRTYNYYATIAKDRANLEKFMKSFPDLDQRLQQLSQQTGQKISYKTNSTLTALASDNDNIKFFYYDDALKPQIEATVKSWQQANGIIVGDRTHVHGVDIKGQGSYGEIITKHINDQFNAVIQQYGSKYTPEQYYEWLGKNFTTLIKQVSVK